MDGKNVSTVCQTQLLLECSVDNLDLHWIHPVMQSMYMILTLAAKGLG